MYDIGSWNSSKVGWYSGANGRVSSHLGTLIGGSDDDEPEVAINGE